MIPVARIESLGKYYRVNHAEQRLPYKTLRDSLMRAATTPIRRWRAGGHEGVVEQFWALKDVNFDVQPGEVIGIIGRNGAGKSTLLKVLSRITKPSCGCVTLRGRVGSLLEVGTGFHPELSGRENIFMNGSILGMTRQEIRRKFDEIVEFSDVERFLDTPVKRYSSGMQVRLAFAVAAHLDPEILIVDEVLAVGDLGFQRKCIGRMNEVSRSGCTILLVSHNMSAIEGLCTRAILMDSGKAVHDGSVPDVVREYRQKMMQPTHLSDHNQRSRCVRMLRSIALLDENCENSNYLPVGRPCRFRITIETNKTIELPTIGIGIDDTMGQRLLTVHTPLTTDAIPRLFGKCIVDCIIDRFPLCPGDYLVKMAIAVQGQELDSVDGAMRFSIIEGELFGEGRSYHRGICVAPSRWRLVD